MIRFCATKPSSCALRRADEVERQVRIGLRASARRSGDGHRVGALAAARLDHDGRELADERRRRRRADRVRVERHVEAAVVDARVVERPEHPHRRDDADDGAPRPRLRCRRRVTVRKRRPIALSLPKCFRANAALTIATGWRASRSSSVKVRPSSSFWPVTAKKPPVTCSKLAVRPIAASPCTACPRSRSGRCRRTPCGSGW